MATCPRPPAPRRAGGGAGVVEGEACALACAAVCGAWERAVRVRPRALAPIYDCAPLPSIKCTYIYNLKGLKPSALVRRRAARNRGLRLSSEAGAVYYVYILAVY